LLICTSFRGIILNNQVATRLYTHFSSSKFAPIFHVGALHGCSNEVLLAGSRSDALSELNELSIVISLMIFQALPFSSGTTEIKIIISCVTREQTLDIFPRPLEAQREQIERSIKNWHGRKFSIIIINGSTVAAAVRGV
jgi:hypothetical protein